MKKNTVLLLLLLLGFSGVRSQEYKKIDTSSIIFIYNYQFYEEHKNPESIYRQDMVLEIGEQYSKFYSATRRYTDSLVMLYINESPDVAFSKIRSQVGNLPSSVFSSFYVYKGYPTSGGTMFTSRDLGAANYYSVAEKLNFNWQVDNSTKLTILGFNCTKATCNFAGRDYEAWFTTEIPISDGPYKFNGLPGLIVKIADSKGEHIFELQEVKNVKNLPIYFIEHNAIKTDAKGYVKALNASKTTYIDQLNSLNYSNDAMRVRAIYRVQKRDNFIERY